MAARRFTAFPNLTIDPHFRESRPVPDTRSRPGGRRATSGTLPRNFRPKNFWGFAIRRATELWGWRYYPYERLPHSVRALGERPQRRAYRPRRMLSDRI
jgi:hypothetical protein